MLKKITTIKKRMKWFQVLILIRIIYYIIIKINCQNNSHDNNILFNKNYQNCGIFIFLFNGVLVLGMRALSPSTKINKSDHDVYQNEYVICWFGCFNGINLIIFIITYHERNSIKW